MLSVVLDFLFPKKCIGCKKTGSYFCPDCISEIKQTDLVCPFCERLALGGVVHPVCERKYGLDGLWSLGIYENPLRAAVQKLKYKWISELANILSNLLIEYWARYQPHFLDKIKKDHGENWIIVPVPLHWTRQNKRGYNQSALLGKLLAKKMGLKYESCLKRTRPTKPQVGLDSYQRKQNIRNAFALKSNDQRPMTNVLLIDDVWTTGSTLRECCYVLKRAGAKQVWAITLAK